MQNQKMAVAAAKRSKGAPDKAEEFAERINQKIVMAPSECRAHMQDMSDDCKKAGGY